MRKGRPTQQGRAPTAEDPGARLARFAVAGEDRAWHWAEARIDGDTVVCTSPEVPRPVAVRYCYRNFQLGNLKNCANLPLLPFRTDNW